MNSLLRVLEPLSFRAERLKVGQIITKRQYFNEEFILPWKKVEEYGDMKIGDILPSKKLSTYKGGWLREGIWYQNIHGDFFRDRYVKEIKEIKGKEAFLISGTVNIWFEKDGWIEHCFPEEVIQVGDEVRCITSDEVKEDLSASNTGAGFQEGLVFIVNEIRTSPGGEKVYYGGKNGNGVYDSCVLKVINYAKKEEKEKENDDEERNDEKVNEEEIVDLPDLEEDTPKKKFTKIEIARRLFLKGVRFSREGTNMKGVQEHHKNTIYTVRDEPFEEEGHIYVNVASGGNKRIYDGKVWAKIIKNE